MRVTVGTRRRTIGLIAVVVALISIAGCGSSGSDGSENSNLHGDPIVIGNIGTYSGPAAPAQVSAKYAIEAWSKTVNSAGGIDGRPVKVVIEDDAGDAAKSASLVKKMVESDHIVAMVGSGANSGGWSEYLASKNVPVVGGLTTDLGMVTSPNHFSTGGNVISNFWGIANIAKTFGPDIGIAYCSEVPQCGAASKFIDGLGKPLGVSVAYNNGISSTAPDYTATCLAIKKAGVQSYVLLPLSSVLERVIERCHTLGVSAQLIQPGTTANSTRVGHSAFNGTLFVDNTPPYFLDSTPAAKEYQAAIKKYAPNNGSDSVPASSAQFNAWVAGKLFEAAVKASGTKTVDSASVKKGLYALKGETLGGLTPPLTYSPGKPTLFNCYYTYKLTKSGWTTPDGVKPTCADVATNQQIATVATSLAK